MKYNLSKIKENNDYKERFIPGVWEVEILSVAEQENKNGKPFLGVIITDIKEGIMEHQECMYLTTDGGKNAAFIKIRELYRAIYGKNGAPEGDFSVEQMNTQLSGRKLRVKLNGEEYMNNDVLYTRPGFPYKGFAESINVPLAESRLKLVDRDIKRLPKEVVVEAIKIDKESVAPDTGLNFG